MIGLRSGSLVALLSMTTAVACGGTGSDGSGAAGQSGTGGAAGSGGSAGGSGGASGSSGAGGSAGDGGSSGAGGSAGDGGSAGAGGTGGTGGSSGAGGAAGAGGAGGGGDLGAPAWLYYKEWSGSYHVVDAAKASPQPIEVPGKYDLYNQARFSKDGKRFALVTASADVAVWSLASGTAVLETTLTGLTDDDLHLSPPSASGDPWLDADRLLYAALPTSGKKLLGVAQIASATSNTITEASVSAFSDWYTSPTGAWLAWRDGNEARVARTTQPFATFDLGNRVIVGFSSDGKRLALRQVTEGVVSVYGLTTGTPVLEWSSSQGVASNAAWSPSGSLLAIQNKSPSGAVYLADFGQAPPSMTPVSSSFQTPTVSWSSSGKLLVTDTGGKSSVWDVGLAKDVTPPSVTQQFGADFRLSSDDRWLCWEAGGQLHLTDLKSSASSSIPATLGAFTNDASAFVGCKFDTGGLGCVHFDLTSGTPTTTASFAPQGTEALHVRSLGDVHYVFSLDAESGKHSKLFALPLVNGVALASRQLSGQNHFVYNGLHCVDCRPIH